MTHGDDLEAALPFLISEMFRNAGKRSPVPEPLIHSGIPRRSQPAKGPKKLHQLGWLFGTLRISKGRLGNFLGKIREDFITRDPGQNPIT